jgi:hypothetical protein
MRREFSLMEKGKVVRASGVLTLAFSGEFNVQLWLNNLNRGDVCIEEE